MEFFVNELCTVVLEENEVTVKPVDNSKPARSMWGMNRTRIANMIDGVATEFTKSLELVGVGYRAQMKGSSLNLALGYSHEIDFPVPDGVKIATPKPTEIVVSGIDKQKVGQTAAEIRAFRPPEPYKGKGVKYADEYIFRKEGKKK
jgi:large subunit ribosomal protein L6